MRCPESHELSGDQQPSARRNKRQTPDQVKLIQARRSTASPIHS